MSSFKFNGRRWSFAGAVLVLVGAGAALGAGCGGADIDLSTLSNFCQALAQADCSPAVVTACYGASDTTIDADTQSCIATRSAPEQCNPSSLPYHADQAQPCIDAHSAVYANGQLAATDLQTVEQACLPAFNKGGQAGSVCTLDSDCDAGSGLSCVIHLTKGTCEIPNTVDAGMKCDDPAAQCADGNYCDGSHCVQDPTQGDSCGAGITCGMGLRCNASSKCSAQLPDQAECTANSDCTGGICVPTSGGVSKCFATYIFAADSPTCAPFVDK